MGVRRREQPPRPDRDPEPDEGEREDEGQNDAIRISTMRFPNGVTGFSRFPRLAINRTW